MLRDGAEPREIRRAVLTLAWPAVIEYALTTLIGVANMVMVGRVGAAAVAAVGICNQPLFMAQGVFQSLTVGSTAIVARHMGAGESMEAAEAGRQSVVLTLALGLLASVTVFMIVFTVPILRMYTSDQQVIGMGIFIMRIYAFALPAMGVYFVLIGALRGAGDTRFPLVISFLGIWCVRLMLGNLLALRLGLGLNGAWIAMVCDQWIRG